MRNEAADVLNGFLDAEYGVDAPASAPLHVGEDDGAAWRRCWITAWNPLGLARDDDANAQAQAALQADLDAARCARDTGFARSPAGLPGKPWHEPCAVLHDASDALLDRLARRYRQLAVVVADPGAPARLRCYRQAWIERFGIADMDAPNVEWVA